MDVNQKKKKAKTYFKDGLTCLLQGKFDESVTGILLGCLYSPDANLLSSTLDNLVSMSKKDGAIKEGKFVEEILQICLAFRFTNSEVLSRLKSEYTQKDANIKSPVIILAGSTAKGMEKTVELTKNTMIQAFQDYHGSLIGGGTSSGVSGIAGDLQEHYASSIRVIGYVPKLMPEDVTLDKRYSRISHTDGDNFSIRDPIQYWLDILLSGIPPEEIAVIGVGGGRISSFEYRFAAILGVRVGIIEIPGWVVPLPLQDEAWASFFIHLKNVSTEIKRFLPKNH